MRKILFIIIAILGFSFVAESKPKSLKQAEKLIGNFAEREQARKLIAEAMADSLIASTPLAHYIAGRIEKEVYRHYYKMLSINRNDPAVDHAAMADALLGAYNQFVITMSKDTVIDKKGKVKVNYSPGISEWISSIAPAMYNSGIAYMNKQAYFPKAYDAFITYASLPDCDYYRPEVPVITDSLRANAYFYGGVMAYNAGEYKKAAEAFDKSRKHGYSRKEVYLNEMSCLTQIAQADSAKIRVVSKEITNLAKEGFEKYGLASPLFIQKYVAGLMMVNEVDSAINVIDKGITMADTDASDLHAMKAAVLAIKGDASAAAEEYKVAASSEKAGFTTLQKGSQHIAMIGLTLLDAVTGRNREARQRIKKIKEDYLQPALDFAKRAQTLKPDDPIVNNTIETVSYYLH